MQTKELESKPFLLHGIDMKPLNYDKSFSQRENQTRCQAQDDTDPYGRGTYSQVNDD
jgi:hypothetical protein